jgi:2-keto-3-deoxy-L-rhamnonate aldolase RhmA
VIAKKSFAELLAAGPPQIGTLISLASLDTIDVLSQCGFDWMFLDLEHSSLSFSQTKALVQVVAGRAFMLPRIADNHPVEIQKALDIGCDGVIVPLVNSKSEAEAAVRFAKYPPDGERSVGIGRAQGYGIHFKDYVENANANISVIIQIEHEKAIENIDDILSVKGIDAVFIGPYDLSGSMNLLGKITDARVQSAIQAVRSKCAAKGIPYGIFALTAEDCAQELAHGAKFVALGVDTMHLYHGAQSQLEVVKNSIPRGMLGISGI